MTNSNQTNQDQKYFDLHVSGIGYLYRAREVQVKRGQSFLAVEVSALHGEAEDVNYTRFDCRVSGKDAQDVIRLLMPEIQAKKKVLVSFKLGDLYPETFVYDKGEKVGQTGVSLKARLLKIHWAKVDGKHVLPVASDAPAPGAQDAAADEPLAGEFLPAQTAARSNLDGLI
ncbi:MAG: DUF3577 domain-containing protein [Gammaproteobacteria bacterium]|nr:DUF3577 domain-containing protein [Gammaproteobacteria bacterium]